MQKLKIVMIMLVMLLLAIFSYAWFYAADQIKAGFEEEVKKTNMIGMNFTISDYKYSGFPFKIGITAKKLQVKLKMQNTNDIIVVELGSLKTMCDILIKNCKTSIIEGEKLKIFRDDNKKQIFEIDFKNNFSVDTIMSRSFLIASILEENPIFDEVLKELKLTASDISIYNFDVNQEIGNIMEVSLIEEHNHLKTSSKISSLKLSTKIISNSNSSHPLSSYFKNLDIESDFDIYKNEQDSQVIGKIFNLNNFNFKIDNSSISAKGRLTLNQTSPPLDINAEIDAKNYDLLIHKYLDYKYDNNQDVTQKMYPVLKTIVEKITGNPYNTNNANFLITTKNDRDNSIISIGGTYLAEIYKLLLNQYSE